jgi:hypothetical protein
MSIIPLDLQRRFEQRWAAKLASPVPSAAPKSIQEEPSGMKRGELATVRERFQLSTGGRNAISLNRSPAAT